MNNKEITIINLFGVPSAGKTAVRSQLFGALKTQFINIEEIQEIAKIRKNMGMSWALSEDQMGVFADQNTLQLISKKEGFKLAVTDSPLLLSAFYAPQSYLPEFFSKLVLETFNSYNNINYFIYNDFDHKNQFFEEGRNHGLEWSKANQQPLIEFLESKGLEFKILKMSDVIYLDIISDLKHRSII